MNENKDKIQNSLLELFVINKSLKGITLRILKDNILDFLREQIEYETENEFIEYYTESYIVDSDLLKDKEEILTDFYIFLDNDYIKDCALLRKKILDNLDELEEEKDIKIRYVNEIIRNGDFNPFLKGDKNKIIEDFVVYNAIK